MTFIHRLSLCLHLVFIHISSSSATVVAADVNADATAIVSVDELHRAAADALYSKKPADALQFISEALQMEPNDPSLLNTAGVVVKSNGDVDKAADFFAASLKIDPTYFNANYNAANLMQFDIFDTNKTNADALDLSIQYYRRALETMKMVLSSNNNTDSLASITTISKEEQVAFLNDASVALKKKSRNNEAIELLTKVLEIDTTNARALGNLALTYLDIGDIQSAHHASAIALGRRPDDVVLHRNHALILQHMNASSDLVQVHLKKAVGIEKKDDPVIFGMSFNHRNTGTNETSQVNIELKKTDNPIAIVNELQSQLDLDLLTYRWLHATFQHAVARLDAAKVLEVPIDVDGQTFPPIDVHYGDDLSALTRSYAFLHGLSSSSEITDSIYRHLLSQIPQHMELEWVNSRKRQVVAALKPKGSSSKDKDGYPSDYLSISRDNNQHSSKNCKVTLAIVTSGKLSFFYNLVQKFPATDLICEIMVFDYSSSAADRSTMMREFPKFNFVFIAEQDKGHAQILNQMIKTVKSKYLLYLNDAWEPLGDTGERIQRAYSLMEAAAALRMPIVQVLMNEQSAQSCALGTDLEGCRSNKSYKKAGWLRTVTIDDSSFGFLEHEFGVQYLDHEFSSYWPGFSSRHPALWNLNLITSNANHVFNEGHGEYDTIFSLQIMESGLTTVHLPDVGFRFMGE